MEESEDANPVKKHPSLPENYVTIGMLKERWLQRKKQEEEEEQLKLQRSLKPDPIEENPNGSELGTVPVIRNPNRRQDPRGCAKEREEEPESTDSAAIRGNREIRAEKKKKRFRERRKYRANVAVWTMRNVENRGKEEGGELQLPENSVEKASGRSRSGRRRWRKRFKRNEGRLKVQQQGENGNKDGEGFVGLAKDTTPPAAKIDESFQDLSLNDPKNAIVKTRATKIIDRQGSTQCVKMAKEERRVVGGRRKIDESFQDSSLNDPKNAIGRTRATKIKDQQGSTQFGKMAEEERRVIRGRRDRIAESFQDLSLNDPNNAIVKTRATKIKDQQGSTQSGEMAEEERRVLGGRRDRMRIYGGGGGRGWRQMGHRRASSTRARDKLVWVKKEETPGGCVTTHFNSQVPSVKDSYLKPQP